MKVAAIGTFDGVHRGHLSVLKKLTEYSQETGLQPIVITFDRHPLALIEPQRTPGEITPLWKKKNLLKDAGVTPVVVEFDEHLRATTAEEWMQRIKKEMGVSTLVIGYDNTFGSDGVSLSLEDYKKLGEKTGILILSAEEIKGVSSSAIRKAIAAGDMEKAQDLLGRHFSLTATVVNGNGLGHTIGFPTANIDWPEGAAIPKPGVYAATVKSPLDGNKYPAMVNIGTRPTVMRGDKPVIEAHIIDWDGNLYGRDITLSFIKRLRDEQKFESIDALKQQLALDRQDVKDLMEFE